MVGMPPAAYLSRGVHAADKLDPCLVRGGETELDAKFPSISNFLTTEEREQALENFHIHGWRWHTSSLIREARRFCTLAQRAQSAQGEDALNSIAEALQAAAEYVIGFNMKGLHRIEADLMFPWMREKLTKTESIPREASDGFDVAMTQLENDRKQLTNIGESIVSQKQRRIHQHYLFLQFHLTTFYRSNRLQILWRTNRIHLLVPKPFSKSWKAPPLCSSVPLEWRNSKTSFSYPLSPRLSLHPSSTRSTIVCSAILGFGTLDSIWWQCMKPLKNREISKRRPSLSKPFLRYPKR